MEKTQQAIPHTISPLLFGIHHIRGKLNPSTHSGGVTIVGGAMIPISFHRHQIRRREGESEGIPLKEEMSQQQQQKQKLDDEDDGLSDP